MSMLTQRIAKLEEANNPRQDPESTRRAEELAQAIEAGRKRVKAIYPGFEFSDEPLDPAPLLPNGKLDIAAVLSRPKKRVTLP